MAKEIHTPYIPIIVSRDKDGDFNCDGTDDHIEIQDALDYANELKGFGAYVRVVIKHGVYDIAGEITVYDDVPVHGEGLPILDGTNLDQGGLQFIFLSTDDLGKNDFEFVGLGFKGLVTHDTVAWGALPASGGILVNNCRFVRIHQCFFTDCWNGATLGIDRDTKSAIQGPLNVQNVEFTENFVYECLGGLQGYGMQNVIWDSNTFEKVSDDCCAFLNVDSGTTPHAKNAVCTNNIFKNGLYQNDEGVDGVGILLKVDGSSGGSSERVADVVCSGNVVENAEMAVWVAEGNRVTITNNNIDTTYKSAIYVSSATDNQIIIAHNNIKNANEENTTSHAFITFLGDKAIIQGNLLQGQNSTNEGGIKVQSSAQHVSILDNQLFDIGNLNIYFNANFAMVHGNRIVGASNTTYGIQSDGSDKWSIKNNLLTGNFDNYAMQFVNTSDNGSIHSNELIACNKGISIEVGASDNLNNLSVIGNQFLNFTGSTSDGEPMLQFVLNSTDPVNNLIVADNQMLDGDNTYYLGLTFGGSADVNNAIIKGNQIRGNKYGMAINMSGTWDKNNYYGNSIYGNGTYDVNEFSTVFTDREVGHNIES